ncbi:MAG: alpha/beta hydrolase [Candidatus Omnitrophica bacterium]|nr:alpha/beta hydrolase [Candidatus Omnitrophota bacterium]
MRISRPTLKKKIEIDRFSVPIRIYGDAGPHLVCVNGVQQSMAMWHSFVTRFSSEYRIALFDFPGQGKARVLCGPQKLSLDEQVDILHEVIKSVEFDNKTTLSTASWGGVVALAFAARYPDVIKQLVLGSIGTRPNQKMIETIQKGLSIDAENRLEMAEVLIQSFGQNLPVKIKRDITSQFRSMSADSLQTFNEHGLLVLSTKNLTDLVDLGKIKANAVILRGEHDTIIDLEDVHFLASKIPNCIVKIVEDVGHFMHLETHNIFDVYSDAFAGKYFEPAAEKIEALNTLTLNK